MNFTPRTMEEIEEEVARVKADWPEQLPERFSATQVTMLARCQEQYRHRYVLGIKEAPAPALIFGQADSEAVGEHFRRQMDTGTGFGVEEIGDFFATRYAEIIEERGGLSEVTWVKDRVLPREAAVKMRDEQRRLGSSLVSAYRKEVADSVAPTGVEVEINVEQPVWPVPVIGYLDIEEEGRVIERKTSARKVDTPKSDWIAQQRIYQLATQKPLSWHISVKTKEPQIIADTSALTLPYEPVRAQRTVLMVSQAMRTVANNLRDYGPDQPWPGAETHPWACGFCGYAATCIWK